MQTRRNVTFVVGECYTRKEINAVVGGSVQSYLPTFDGRVVAACFNEAYDPDAPEIVLPGVGPIIERTALQLTRQGNAVPTFIKKAVNCWEYVGNYKVSRQSFDESEIYQYASKAGRVGDITSVLFLEGEQKSVCSLQNQS